MIELNTAVKWEIWLAEPGGTRIALLDNALEWNVVRSLNNPGFWRLTLPFDFDASLLRVDGLVEFWRAPSGGSLRNVLTGFIRKWIYTQDAIEISGPGLNELLSRRVVAYKAGTSQALKNSAIADTAMVAVVKENLGGDATDTDRDVTGLGLTIQTAPGNGPGVSISASYDNVLDVLKDISKQSVNAGTNIYFDIIQTGEGAYNFQTYENQPGVDNTYPDGASPILFGLEFGNLADPVHTIDRGSEINYMYAGGIGEIADRSVQEASVASLIGESIWNRREGYANFSQVETPDDLDNAAKGKLDEYRPIETFTGTLLDTPQSRYGIDWNWGDRVTVQFRGQNFNGLVRGVAFSVKPGSAESTAALGSGQRFGGAAGLPLGPTTITVPVTPPEPVGGGPGGPGLPPQQPGFGGGPGYGGPGIAPPPIPEIIGGILDLGA